jgi:hypothetical protein
MSNADNGASSGSKVGPDLGVAVWPAGAILESSRSRGGRYGMGGTRM